jgi:cytochrome c551/c552
MIKNLKIALSSVGLIIAGGVIAAVPVLSTDEVAEKYSKNSSAEELLTIKIKVGGVDVWGENTMPLQPQMADAEARVIVKS